MTVLNRKDLQSDDDVILMVNTFYERVRADEILAPIFDDVARVDWETHLPRMYAFWEAVLFGKQGFKGDPLAKHRELALLTPLTSREFGRWVDLFHDTVDDLFLGPIAEGAKQRAERIAVVMQSHISGLTSLLAVT